MSIIGQRGIQLAYQRPALRLTRYTSGLPKVVVLHDQEFVQELLDLLLVDQIEVVASTHSGKAAIALSELLSPDVVVVSELLIDGVIDVFLPGLIRTGTRVLLLSIPLDVSRLLELVELGITGLVDSDQSPNDLAFAVLALAGGGAVFPPDVSAMIAADWRRARRKGTNETHGTELTARELEVLGAMSDGLSAKAVAHHLGIAVKTVENHKTRIFEKLGVRTQAQAVAMAIGAVDASSGPAGIGVPVRGHDQRA